MKLFVYGTLKSGYGNNYLLRDSTKIGDGITKKGYVLFQCGFPKAVPFHQVPPEIVLDFDILPVMGEVWEVSEKDLHSIDRLEGHPNWYERKIVTILVNNEETEAWIYEMPEWQTHTPVCSIQVVGGRPGYVWNRG